MNKKALTISLSLLSITVIGVGSLTAYHNSDSNVFAFIRRNTQGDKYYLRLNSSNLLKVEDGVKYYSLTDLGNKVYFDWDSSIDRFEDEETPAGWVELLTGPDHCPIIYNTSKIKGMKNIKINSDYSYFEMDYGCELDGEIVYSNRVEFTTTSIDYDFVVGQEPSYFKLRGNDNTLIESIVIEYSCSESAITPTEALGYEAVDGTLDEDDEDVRITGFSTSGSNYTPDLVIPSYIGEHRVVEIGAHAFDTTSPMRMFGFKSITIPNTVTYIGERAFFNCQQVTKINMPTSGITIGPEAFLYCGDMETIDVDKDQASIDLSVYQASPVLTNINVDPENTTYYSVNGVLYAYDYSDGYVEHKNTLLYCPCAKTGTITIPNNVEYIAPTAFKNSKASIIQIGEDVETIKEDFKSATSITAFEVNANNSDFSANVEGYLLDKFGSYLLVYPRGISTDIVYLPNDITHINDYVFDGNNHIETIDLTNVTHIGEGAFANMSNLEAVSLSSVIDIGVGAFKNDTSLATVVFKDSLATIPTEAFMNCSSLAFNNKELPSGLVEIADRAFKGCSSLDLNSLPSHLETIGDEAFMNCTSYDGDDGELYIPSGIQTLGVGTYRHTGISSFVTPYTVTSLPNDFFRECDSLVTITLSNYVKTIGYDTFRDCSNLTTVNIPDNGVQTIHSRAFYGCKISRIFIPECVTLIEGSAFAGGPSILDIDTDVVSPEGQEYSSSSIGGGGWLNPNWSAAFGSGATIYRIHYSQSR